MENQKIKDNNYLAIQGWMVTKLGLSGNELICYAIIFGFSQDGEGSFSGSSAYLCDWMQVSKKTSLTCLAKLVEKNLIIKEEKLVNNVKFCSYKTNDSYVAEGWCKNYTGGVKTSLGGGVKITPNNKHNNNKEMYKESFETFWSIYPKQRAGSKEKAYISFCKAIKENRATEDKIIHSAELYSQSDEVKRGYAKGCAAWLNDDRFNNNYGKEREEWDVGYGRC